MAEKKDDKKPELTVGMKRRAAARKARAEAKAKAKD